MLNEEKLKESIARRLNQDNAEIVKNLLVFQPSRIDLTNKNCPNYTKPLDLPFSRKFKERTFTSFPAGFQCNLKATEENLTDEEKLMMLKSQKAPAVEISSFLLDLKSRKSHQAVEKKVEKEQKMQTLIQKIKTKKTIQKYIKQKKEKRKFEEGEVEFPSLETKKELQIKLHKNTLTPQFNDKNRSMKFNHLSNYQSEKAKARTVKKIYPTKYFETKFFQPVNTLPTKGYLQYEDGAKEFLDSYLPSFQQMGDKKISISLTASNYLVVDKRNLEVLADKRSHEMIQIASLTKIMTCYLCLLVCQKFQINLHSYWVRVSDMAASMPGTTADLEAGDIVTINQLLYGLMLPSGNDASVVIAESMGKIIQKSKKKPSTKSYYEAFIQQMNVLAKELNLEQEFKNSSGLSTNPNLSTPKAITVLTVIAMRNKKFREIINTREYETEIQNERFGYIRKQVWKNTNKLLWKGWEGVKTGTTETAGHCLMSCKENILISVYDCQTLGKRFSECVKLYEKIKGKEEN